MPRMHPRARAGRIRRRAVVALAAVWAAAATPCHAADPATARDAVVRAFAAMPARADGNVVDPVSGMGAPPYAQSAFGFAAAQTWRTSGDPADLAFAERMLRLVAHEPPVPRVASVFDLAAAADAFGLLPADSPVRAELGAWLAAAPIRHWGRSEEVYSHDKQLIQAVGVLRICALGLGGPAPQACLAAHRMLTTHVPAAARDATVVRGDRRVTLLADPPHDVPAYRQLVFAYLAREYPGLAGPAAARRLLLPLARGIVATTAPSGAVALWGRSQEIAWAPVLGAYGLRVAASLAPDPAEAAAFRETAARLLARFEAQALRGPYAVLVTPAFAAAPFTRSAGVDEYVNVATYAGFTALALGWLSELPTATATAFAARPAAAAPAAAAPAGAADGTFTFPRGDDPLAVVRRGPVWFTLRAGDSRNHGGDLRYDFGVVAAEVRTPAGWSPLVALRPRTQRGVVDGAGPVLIRGGRRAWPDGGRMRAVAGGVDVRGGWRDSRGRWVRRATFRFRATPCGVRVAFRARRGDRFEQSAFVAVGSAPLATTALSVPATASTDPAGLASGADADLRRVRLLTARLGRARTVAVATRAAGCG